ncbi:MAG TPA: hypothetical protein VM029_05790, partial [Opitutaceae bacterium]|nr:hypothetical protein [Opitutaceae bacterium]
MLLFRSRFFALGVFLLASHAGSAAPAAPTGFILEVELANDRGGAAQLFYDIGQWYSVVHSSRVEIAAGAALQTYRFNLPAQPVRRLRFDPDDGAATVRVGQLRLLTAAGVELAHFGPERLLPMHSIAGLRVADGIATVITEADDPMLLIARPLQRETTHALGRTIVARGQLLGFALAVGAAMAIALVAAVRGIAPAGHPRAGWVLGGFFLVVFGARLFWLQQYSLPLPFWDEWKTTGIDLVMPLSGGYLEWQALFLPHGEHRIVVTRLASIGSSLVNGEWDPRVAMTLSAFFFAAAIALVCGAMASASRWFGFLLAACLGALACLPFDTRNIYWGDQSPMYALTLFGACTLAIAASPRITRLTLLGGTCAAMVSLGT